MWTLWMAAAGAQPVDIEPAGLRIVDQPAQTFKYLSTDPPGRCLVRVELDASGVPSKVEARGCLRRYAAAAETAVSSWRWSSVGRASVTHVPVAFTPKGTAPVDAAESCGYFLRVASNGQVTANPSPPSAQCQLWPAAVVSAASTATGTCAAHPPLGVGRTADEWGDLEGCDKLAGERIREVMRGSLFTFGEQTTTFTVEFPQSAGAPPASAQVDIGDVPGQDDAVQRVPGADEVEAAGDEDLDVQDLEVPEVVFPDMNDLGGDD